MKTEDLVVSSGFFDNLESPIFVKNKEGIYTYCNTSFSKFLGISSQKIIGHSAFDIAPQNLASIYSESDKLLFEQSTKQEYAATVRRGDLSEVSVNFKKSVYYNANEVAGFIGTVEVLSQTIESSSIESPLSEKKLSTRELEILHLLKQGGSVKKIASQLQISPYTVSDHLKSIYSKLGVHSKTEAVFKALALMAANNI